LAWEEAPLLDDLAVSANFRATLVNLGLVGVRYNKLEQAAADSEGKRVAAHLGISTGQLVHLGRCLLDDMRSQAALSRPLLRIHPRNPHAGDEIRSAAWERRRVNPAGFPCSAKDLPLPALVAARSRGDRNPQHLAPREDRQAAAITGQIRATPRAH